ncbi:MAG: lysophospholipid acyltransferase family protein [Ignavibacteria bacterium]|nr:lysophospholipid acyltransferase family protein [Ignavibacteria bacterium]
MGLGNSIITKLMLVMGAVSGRLSVRARVALGKRIGRILMRASSKRRAITVENVATSLRGATKESISDIVRSAYENLGIVLAELVALKSATREDLLKQVVMPGFDKVIERHKAGLPTILLSAHYGNWEYLAVVAGLLLEAPISIVVHPQSNAEANAVLDSYRTKFGNILLPMHNAARSLVKTLSGGGTVAFLVDQHGHPEKDPWISFMGRATPTYEAPAALALRFDAPIFCTFAERLPDGSYVARFDEIAMSDLDNTKEGILELTRRHVRALEDAIHKKPELWSWQHRRWRYEPPASKAGAA